MKSGLIFVFMATTLTSAHAGVGPGSSWEEIQQSSRHRIDFPVIFFGNTGLHVNEVCVDGADVRSVEPVDVCLEWDLSHSRCARSETVTVFAPIEYMEEKCVKRRRMRCVETALVPATLPLEYKVRVYEKQRYPSRLAFRKMFNIPACE